MVDQEIKQRKTDLSGKRILVTGGAGFIGSHTTEALLSAGAEVLVFDDFSTGKTANLPSDSYLRVLVGDVRDLPALRAAVVGMDAVMHLAAQVSVRVSVEDPVGSAQNNVAGFLNVLQAARDASVSRVVYASSAAVYGAPDRLPLDESSPVRPISPYGLEKLINEQYARLFSMLYGMSCLGLRYFNVYGPRQDPASQYAGVISKFVACFRNGEPLRIFGDGLQTRDFVYVKDVARINVAALRSDETEVLAVGTGRSVTLLDLVEALRNATGRVADVHHAAAAVGDISQSAMLPVKLLRSLDIQPFTSLEVGLMQLVGGENVPNGQ